MKIGTVALYMVIMLDVMGQGLVIPVLTTLLLDPSQTLLDTNTPTGPRELYFGITMGVFFLSWFLGAAYISKLSDFIGRKQGLLICLGGAFLGCGILGRTISAHGVPLRAAWSDRDYTGIREQKKRAAGALRNTLAGNWADYSIPRLRRRIWW